MKIAIFFFFFAFSLIKSSDSFSKRDGAELASSIKSLPMIAVDDGITGRRLSDESDMDPDFGARAFSHSSPPDLRIAMGCAKKKLEDLLDVVSNETEDELKRSCSDGDGSFDSSSPRKERHLNAKRISRCSQTFVSDFVEIETQTDEIDEGCCLSCLRSFFACCISNPRLIEKGSGEFCEPRKALNTEIKEKKDSFVGGSGPLFDIKVQRASEKK